MSKTLSIIIPALNEEQTIARVLHSVERQSTSGWEKEIIVVDDGSSDRTAEIAQAALPSIILLRHNANKGKGEAIRTALIAATGDAVIIQDADLEYSPSDWPALLRELQNPDVDVVYGSRNLNPERRGYAPYVIGVWALTVFCNILYGSHLTDIYTGAKLFRARALDNIRTTATGFEWEAEVTAKLLKRGMTIKEVPISYTPRAFSAGKKIRTWDGVKGFWMLLKQRIVP